MHDFMQLLGTCVSEWLWTQQAVHAPSLNDAATLQGAQGLPHVVDVAEPSNKENAQWLGMMNTEARQEALVQTDGRVWMDGARRRANTPL